jgi:hypothetical protein
VIAFMLKKNPGLDAALTIILPKTAIKGDALVGALFYPK